MTSPKRPARSTAARAASADADAGPKAAPATGADAASSPEAAPGPDAALAPAAPATVELYLVRHADAGDPGAWTGDDALRPLSPKGRRQARRLANLLCDLRWRPDVLLTSPKLRARQTAEPIGKEIRRRFAEDERLGAGLLLAGVAEILGEHPGVERIMLVGHDPDLTAIASELTGAAIEVRKGALVRIDLPTGSAAAGEGVLRWLVPPGVLPR
jgi:phosphohistidine phosphatase